MSAIQLLSTSEHDMQYSPETQGYQFDLH